MSKSIVEHFKKHHLEGKDSAFAEAAPNWYAILFKGDEVTPRRRECGEPYLGTLRTPP